MKKQKNIYREKGQTLLELLLAFSVLVLVLSAAILGVTTSLSNAQYAKNQNLANSYAQQGMTVVRQVRDSDWTKFSQYTTNASYCLGTSSMDLVPLTALNCKEQNPVPAGGIFSREIKFDHNKLTNNCCSDNSLSCSTGISGSKVTVKVSWPDSKCPVGNSLCNKVELITCFSNISITPTP